MVKNKTIIVNDISVGVTSLNENDYICLTDITKGLENGSSLVENWLRNKNTVEFLGVWEQLNNPNFNSLEFEGIMKQTGLNRFHISVKKWVDTTNAEGLISKTGRYGGTYAHKDIAFEFAAWISPVFKLYLIKEFQRLKQIESNEHNLEWDVRRIISKANFHIHTEAVKNYIIPNSNLPASKQGIEYANESDILNIAVFGYTAQQWREANPERHLNKENIRDSASINELAVLSNLESASSQMIKANIPKNERLVQLSVIAKEQLKILNNNNPIKSLKKMSEDTYLNAKSKMKTPIDPQLKQALDYNPKD